LAFTRTPSDTSVTPAVYQGTDSAEELFLVDQQKDIRVNGAGGDNLIAISAAALSASALYNIESYGNDGDDEMFISANLVQDSIVQGGNGDDTIGAGATTFTSSFNNSTVRGGANNDTILLVNVNNGIFNGNKGNDVIDLTGNAANANVFGGSENDIITAEGGTNYDNSTFNGDLGNDIISANTGTYSGASLNGGAGNDVIFVNNSVTAGVTIDGSIVANGEDGNDVLNIANSSAGGLNGQVTQATATGGDGNDSIFLGVSQSASVDGGIGADTIDASTSAAAALITVTFESGDSLVATQQSIAGTSLATTDTITFGKGVDVLTNIQATDRIDIDFTDTVVDDVTNASLNTVLETGNIYEVYGSFNTANNRFIVGTTGGVGDPDSLYIVGGENLTLGTAFLNNDIRLKINCRRDVERIKEVEPIG
jgi:hypothetical protein